MIKYRVKHYFSAPLILVLVPSEYDFLVDELVDVYGLRGFTRYDVFEKWNKFSKQHTGIDWMTPDVNCIEQAFNVKLEAISL